MNRFEIVNKYADAGLNLPARATIGSAGYDFEVAEDTLIEPYNYLMHQFQKAYDTTEVQTLDMVAAKSKELKAKPTLVPTGIKCAMDSNLYLELSVRSSCPLKHWLILANGEGIIDSDYYNNSSNEGEIFFQIINLSPFPILLKKGDKIGQGIFKRYEKVDFDNTEGIRQGGFGSTTTYSEDSSITKTVLNKE